MDVVIVANCTFRPMIQKDLPEVLEIERSSFAWAWGAKALDRWLRGNRNRLAKVIQSRNEVVGHVCYELKPDRIVLWRLAVQEKRRGVGREALNMLVDKLSGRRRVLEVVVRETNLDAQLFFRACGFRATQVLRSYFEDSGEDGYLMRRGVFK